MILVISIFVSIALPIDRAMPYFHFVCVVMSILVLFSLAGICYYLSVQTFYTPAYVENTNPNTKDTYPYVEANPPYDYFNVLTLAGVIMLVVYILPFLMRPLDFLKNAKKYIVGFISYMLLMPMFTNIFQVYAMCNLHDISWGNRPTSTGTETYTANKNDQAKIEADYKVFRTNFVLFWLAGNILYYIIIV
jgi:cellulose synthase/poly-beta-1,6-N-acetylglucosamine synthase-like glycosyltransferase